MALGTIRERIVPVTCAIGGAGLGLALTSLARLPGGVREAGLVGLIALAVVTGITKSGTG